MEKDVLGSGEQKFAGDYVFIDKINVEWEKTVSIRFSHGSKMYLGHDHKIQTIS